MQASLGSLVMALAIPAIAALGGAAAVFGGFDDSPGGTLLGFLLILGALALSVRDARRRT